MCNHPKCIYIDILKMTNGEKLYIHYDTRLVPLFFQYYDEHRDIEREYVMEERQNIYFDISENIIIYDGTIEITPDVIVG